MALRIDAHPLSLWHWLMMSYCARNKWLSHLYWEPIIIPLCWELASLEFWHFIDLPYFWIFWVALLFSLSSHTGPVQVLYDLGLYCPPFSLYLSLFFAGSWDPANSPGLTLTSLPFFTSYFSLGASLAVKSPSTNYSSPKCEYIPSCMFLLKNKVIRKLVCCRLCKGSFEKSLTIHW